MQTHTPRGLLVEGQPQTYLVAIQLLISQLQTGSLLKGSIFNVPFKLLYFDGIYLQQLQIKQIIHATLPKNKWVL